MKYVVSIDDYIEDEQKVLGEFDDLESAKKFVDESKDELGEFFEVDFENGDANIDDFVKIERVEI